MKQTRSLSEFSWPFEFIRLYPIYSAGDIKSLFCFLFYLILIVSVTKYAETETLKKLPSYFDEIW